MMSLVGSPLATEETAIAGPGHRAVAVSLAGLKVSFVLCVLDLARLSVMARGHTVVVLQCTVAIGPAILETPIEPVAVLEHHLGLPVQPTIKEGPCPLILFTHPFLRRLLLLSSGRFLWFLTAAVDRVHAQLVDAVDVRVLASGYLLNIQGLLSFEDITL